jgi:glutaredoxin
MSYYFVYGKENCTYCDRAVSLLTSQEQDYTLFKLGEHFSKEELLEKFPNAKTFPQIVYVNNMIETYIGGFAQLNMLLKEDNDE